MSGGQQHGYPSHHQHGYARANSTPLRGNESAGYVDSQYVGPNYDQYPTIPGYQQSHHQQQQQQQPQQPPFGSSHSPMARPPSYGTPPHTRYGSPYPAAYDNSAPWGTHSPQNAQNAQASPHAYPSSGYPRPRFGGRGFRPQPYATPSDWSSSNRAPEHREGIAGPRFGSSATAGGLPYGDSPYGGGGGGGGGGGAGAGAGGPFAGSERPHIQDEASHGVIMRERDSHDSFGAGALRTPKRYGSESRFDTPRTEGRSTTPVMASSVDRSGARARRPRPYWDTGILGGSPRGTSASTPEFRGGHAHTHSHSQTPSASKDQVAADKDLNDALARQEDCDQRHASLLRLRKEDEKLALKREKLQLMTAFLEYDNAVASNKLEYATQRAQDV